MKNTSIHSQVRGIIVASFPVLTISQGASRYRSSAASVPTAQQSQYADPFTGASRYVASSQSANNPVSQSSGDPFTGASRYSGAASVAASAPAAQPAAKVIPAVRIYILGCVNWLPHDVLLDENGPH